MHCFRSNGLLLLAGVACAAQRCGALGIMTCRFEFRLWRCSVKATFYYAIQVADLVCDMVADQICDQACDLDSAMEFGFKSTRTSC